MSYYTNERLNDICDRTSGHCTHCGKQLAFKNYGKPGRRGAWEVDHSRAKAKGGTDHLNNLYAACIDCNRGKGTYTARTARQWHGRTRPPLSVQQRRMAKIKQALAGGFAGGLLGVRFFGPWGLVIGASAGAALGYRLNPDG